LPAPFARSRAGEASDREDEPRVPTPCERSCAGARSQCEGEPRCRVKGRERVEPRAPLVGTRASPAREHDRIAGAPRSWGATPGQGLRERLQFAASPSRRPRKRATRSRGRAPRAQERPPRRRSVQLALADRQDIGLRWIEGPGRPRGRWGHLLPRRPVERNLRRRERAIVKAHVVHRPDEPVVPRALLMAASVQDE
jgi:hypothetical protein